MTRADNSLVLLGRSRDTGYGAAACPPQAPTPRSPLLRVSLRVWGETTADALDAERTARDSILAGLWDIVEVVPVEGRVCPIPVVDAAAVAQGADYGRAWAVYRTGRA